MIYVGIDCGTQGTKAILWDSQQNIIISSAYQAYDVISSRYGQKEQHPDYWINAVQTTVKRAVRDAGISPQEIGGMGVSGQQHGLVLLDKHNHVLRPAKLWCDTEPTDDLRHFLSSFTQKYQQDIHAFTGIHIPVAFTIAKLLWVRNHHPEVFSRIDKILLPHEYINFWLTGNYCAESGDASGSGYFDTRNRSWSKTVVDEIASHLYEKLPPLIESHSPAGLLSSSAAELMDLPAGLPVSSGGGDNMMAAIGTGNIVPEILTLSLGTSGTLFTCSEYQVDSSHQSDINSFCSSSNSWLPLISTMNVTNAVNAFREILDIPLTQFETALDNSTAGSNGLYCFPWFNGSRYPDIPDAKASLHGITTLNFTKDNLLRCVVEGATYKICKGIEEFKQRGLNFKQIRVIGGGAKSANWCQMIADITGHHVIRPPVTEAAALGAALQARWCHENIMLPMEQVKLLDIIPQFLLESQGDVFIPDSNQNNIYRLLCSEYHKNLQQVIQLSK